MLRKALAPEGRKGGRRAGLLQGDMAALMHASSLLQVSHREIGKEGGMRKEGDRQAYLANTTCSYSVL